MSALEVAQLFGFRMLTMDYLPHFLTHYYFRLLQLTRSHPKVTRYIRKVELLSMSFRNCSNIMFGQTSVLKKDDLNAISHSVQFHLFRGVDLFN